MARSLWTGALTFGLVSVPIRLVSATRSHDVHFNMLCADQGVRVRRKLVCGDSDQEVSPKDTVKGYEVAPDQYAVVTQEELDALVPEKTRDMTVEQFISLDEIDPIYFDRSYYLLPAEAGIKGYMLLQRVMQETGKVAIARFVMRNKEYLVAIRPQEQVLGLAILHFHDEVVPVQDLVDELPRQPVAVDDRQLKMAEQLVATLTEEWRPEQFEDQYHQRVLDLVEAKVAGKSVVTTVQDERREPGKVIDLMAALEQSLAQAGQAGGKRAGKAKADPGAKPKKAKPEQKSGSKGGGRKGGRKSA
jgi:DNA end-binding protein Ku